MVGDTSPALGVSHTLFHVSAICRFGRTRAKRGCDLSDLTVSAERGNPAGYRFALLPCGNHNDPGWRTHGL
jgi:hypothetical protein